MRRTRRSASFPFYSLVVLLVSYYVFVGRRKLSMTLVVFLEAVFPIAGRGLGYWIGGLAGFWFGYALAPTLIFALAMLVEESLMAVKEVNGGRPCRCEVSLDVRERLVRMILRDDGVTEALCHKVVASVDAYAAGAPQADDITVMALAFGDAGAAR